MTREIKLADIRVAIENFIAEPENAEYRQQFLDALFLIHLKVTDMTATSPSKDINEIYYDMFTQLNLSELFYDAEMPLLYFLAYRKYFLNFTGLSTPHSIMNEVTCKLNHYLYDQQNDYIVYIKDELFQDDYYQIVEEYISTLEQLKACKSLDELLAVIEQQKKIATDILTMMIAYENKTFGEKIGCYRYVKDLFEFDFTEIKQLLVNYYNQTIEQFVSIKKQNEFYAKYRENFKDIGSCSIRADSEEYLELEPGQTLSDISKSISDDDVMDIDNPSILLTISDYLEQDAENCVKRIDIFLKQHPEDLAQFIHVASPDKCMFIEATDSSESMDARRSSDDKSEQREYVSEEQEIADILAKTTEPKRPEP